MTDIDDAERAAMQLLTEIEAGHPVLRNWVDILLEEPFYTVSLDRFSDLPAVQDVVAEAADKRYAVGHIEAAVSLGQSHADERRVQPNQTDAAVYHLACALVARRCLRYGLESDGYLENWERYPHLPDAIKTYKDTIATVWGDWARRPQHKRSQADT